MQDCWIGYNTQEIAAQMIALKEKSFRAKQVMEWLHKGREFEEMSNLPATLVQKLTAHGRAQGVRIAKTVSSQKDDTQKYLFALSDGNLVEGVLMRYKYGNTLCISSQVGCAMGCTFCASTLEGKIRDLTAGEMLSQVVMVNRLHQEGDKRGVTNVVLMGSGEPLDNYENVLSFLRLLSAPEGICISLRNVSLSTCGLVPQIERLAQEGLPLTLSISLHATTDAARCGIMPIARRYNLEQLMGACRHYAQVTSRRIVFEYAMIEGVNTSLEDATRLARLMRGMPCHVNVIPLNNVPERQLTAPSARGVQAFIEKLEELHVSVTRRREMGADIEGACGQLRRKHINSEE